MSELAYEDIKVGNEASLTRTITEVHIVNYAGLTGDMNPVHVDAEHAAQSMFGERIAHGMLVAGLISGKHSAHSRAVMGGAVSLLAVTGRMPGLAVARACRA